MEYGDVNRVFHKALGVVEVLYVMRSDLPDGMWSDIKERLGYYVRIHGKDVSKWSDSVKYDFVEELNSILIDWGFGEIEYEEEEVEQYE